MAETLLGLGMGSMTRLSRQEMDVARLVAEGLPDKEIAALLQIRIGTVKTHIDRIAKKIHATKNRRVHITVWIERAEKVA